MNIKKYCKRVPLFFFVVFIGLTGGLTSTANATDIATDATVVTALTVTQVADLSFGIFSTAGAGGTIDFPAGGVIVVGGGDPVLLGGEVIGDVTIGAAAGNVTVTVTPSVTLTSGANTMTLAPNCKETGAALGTGGICTYVGVGAANTVEVGGTLTVGAAQASGLYTGTITVLAGFY